MKKSIPIYLVLLVVLFLPSLLFAASIDLQIPIPTPGAPKYSVTDITDYIRTFYQFFVTSAGVLSCVMIVFGGFRWLTAAGNAQRIGEAKETITSAIFGLVLALISYILLNTINPSITSLAPLTIPIVQKPPPITGATRRCDFNKELKDVGDRFVPVPCGESHENPESKEICIGVKTSNHWKFCQVSTQSNGELMALESSSIDVKNHPFNTSFPLLGAGTLERHNCGEVNWSTRIFSEDKYVVGTLCPEIGSLEGSTLRCYLNGTIGYFLAQPELDRCARLDASKRPGCGKIANMSCQD